MTGLVDSGDAGTARAHAVGGSMSRKPVLVLGKVRQVLDAFTAQTPALTAREVQQCTGLPATTSLRLLQALVEEGFLDRRGDRYSPGVAMLRWAAVAAEGLDLIGTATPALEELRDATGESACLFVRQGDHHVCVAVARTPHSVRQVLEVGQVLPLHAGSAGRVFLAFDRGLPPLEDLARPALTEHTITAVDRLREAVERTRREGSAVTVEERTTGAASVSAPVFDARGELAAVVGIACPVQRFEPPVVPSRTAEVTRAARRLSRLLGSASGGEVPA
ncbi:IclR family transcriptional regulator [Geodermatophilus sp. DSM 44513]|uniref:IclR family transcriptional regulator n=1 Tax=Geodermatophilus sp. DSM 44513 TaxID=1528104 RepID=UPI001413459D|nr:IclR family transcriptional regulator [Geodermatophilus sp. DSM 44513]WNV74091.1 IclR family transcriptional regulator [Geodermatophilus sp. DSM 44513]